MDALHIAVRTFEDSSTLALPCTSIVFIWYSREIRGFVGKSMGRLKMARPHPLSPWFSRLRPAISQVYVEVFAQPGPRDQDAQGI